MKFKELKIKELKEHLAKAGVPEEEYKGLKKADLIEKIESLADQIKPKVIELPKELIDAPDLKKVMIIFDGKKIESSAFNARLLIRKGLAKLA